MLRRLMPMVLICLVSAACEPRGEVVLARTVLPDADITPVFIGSTRAPDAETGAPFGWERSTGLRFARLDVIIPPDRMRGEINWPKPGNRADPRSQFFARGETVYDGAEGFRRDIGAALAHRDRGDREAFVFVHGFNNNFAEGAYRLAQLGHDLDLGGVFIHYSWPSRAHPLGYAYDRDSALFARDGFETLLQTVAAAGAQRIVIVAHSMGSALAMETLRQMAIAGDPVLRQRIAGVVLVSPDIDVDVFRAQAARIGKLPQPFVIFSSRKDRALALSARLSGQSDRLGNVASLADLTDLEVTLLDTTAFSTGVGHFNAGNSPALLAILGRVADLDSAFAGDPTGRTGLLPGAVLTVQNATEVILSPVSAITGLRR